MSEPLRERLLGSSGPAQSESQVNAFELVAGTLAAFAGVALYTMSVIQPATGHALTVKAFIITPPGEEKGLYRVVADSVRKNQISSKFAELTFTIKRAYGVYA